MNFNAPEVNWSLIKIKLKGDSFIIVSCIKFTKIFATLSGTSAASYITTAQFSSY